MDDTRSASAAASQTEGGETVDRRVVEELELRGGNAARGGSALATLVVPPNRHAKDLLRVTAPQAPTRGRGAVVHKSDTLGSVGGEKCAGVVRFQLRGGKTKAGCRGGDDNDVVQKGKQLRAGG
jgi:hypothetical protein